jgi:putative addiction module CopG family antidote
MRHNGVPHRQEFLPMASPKQVSVALPNDLIEMLKEKVTSGAYASEEEVIADGLRALQERDDAEERWLREEAAATYDAFQANPSRAIPIEQVFAGVEARYRARKAKKSCGE